MDCIYYKETLPASSQEHIIPAALGGINKLPKGYVSDKANAKFSPIELVVMRKSFLAINRENVGPGKRGSLNVKRIKDPKICVLQDFIGQEDNYKIGFVFAGETHMIPQIVMNFNDDENYYSPIFLTTQIDEDGKSLLLHFKDELIDFLHNRRREFKLVDFPFETQKHFVIIGKHNSKWYAATSHKIINMDWLSFFFLNDIREMSIESILPQEMQKVQQHFKWSFKVDTNTEYFIFLKTAFNTCTYYIGSEQICNPCFDPIRLAILNNANCGEFIETFDISKNWCSVVKCIPDKSHYVIIESNEQGVIGYVGFYSARFAGKVMLCSTSIGMKFTKMLVCDWKNRKEYTLCLD